MKKIAKQILLIAIAMIMIFALAGCAKSPEDTFVKNFIRAIETEDVEKIAAMYPEDMLADILESNLDIDIQVTPIHDAYEAELLGDLPKVTVDDLHEQWSMEQFFEEHDRLHYGGYKVTYEISEDSFIVESDHAELIEKCDNGIVPIPQYIVDFYADFENYGKVFFTVTVSGKNDGIECTYDLAMDIFQKGGEWYVDRIEVVDNLAPDHDYPMDFENADVAFACESVLYRFASYSGLEYGVDYAVEHAEIMSNIDM